MKNDRLDFLEKIAPWLVFAWCFIRNDFSFTGIIVGAIFAFVFKNIIDTFI